ncbi:MAG: hypothetical protein KR126chlam1_00218 [Chlamydiae bacterium]|nr:hypothetical protein [Chlamydiota bacterium]
MDWFFMVNDLRDSSEFFLIPSNSLLDNLRSICEKWVLEANIDVGCPPRLRRNTINDVR